MNMNQIFVEGIADAKLIQDLIKSWYNADLTIGKIGDEQANPDILVVGGKDSISKLFPLFKINTNLDVKNIVIFDADIFDIENKKFIEYKKEVAIDYFLLPDNEDGIDNRDLETLLEQIIPEGNKFIFECWENFYKCLESYGENIVHLPTTKKKIYTYLEILLGEDSSTQNLKKELGRDYQNQNHWDLNAPALVNLKQFLDQYFQKFS
jgi:hypothetical protein